ncbi:hypothetical protein PHLCEN_2v6957 [Hermanssonia centrifuga]|uniref:Inosine/uridine-preferring nucleoside hydrolase domain-containing protein n=1 Tax=Hermanssonia centrifuga TaxID=98765 RepID=A0A2R6NY10_9APHY|nr:hypothetical protein PHLCEN_2v6957 [Hermanssonia centrifuga]
MHPDLNVANVGADSWPQLILSDQSGVDVALDIIKSEPARSVTYIVLGPMTTLAHLHRKHGDVLRDRIGRILCMGGALDVPGNTNAVAEFNFFADPYAVRELLTPDPPAIGLPLDRFLLVPLDITTPHEIPFPFYQTYIDKNILSTKRPSNPDEKPPITHFTSSFLERTREVMILFGKDAMELHDIVVVWCAINNPPEGERVVPDESALPALQTGWAAAPRKFQIERLGELTRGMLVVDRRQAEGAYDPGANRALIQADIEKHGFTYAGVLESAAIPAQVEIEQPPSDVLRPAGPGVPVVTTTPGPAALLKLLSERVWGITV